VNEWLTAASRATAAHGRVGCAIWLAVAADRPPRALGDGEWLDLGGKEVQRFDTRRTSPMAGTRACGTRRPRARSSAAISSAIWVIRSRSPTRDIVGPAIDTEGCFHDTSLTPDAGAAMCRLAALGPRRLAVMHGLSYSRPVAPALEALGDYHDGKLRQALTR